MDKFFKELLTNVKRASSSRSRISLVIDALVSKNRAMVSDPAKLAAFLADFEANRDDIIDALVPMTKDV